jgi:hypothetical protein
MKGKLAIKYCAIGDLADKLHSCKAEQEHLKEQMVSAMQDQKLTEVRTDAGLVTFIDDRDMLSINKVRLEEILLLRFNLDPVKLKKAISESHDIKFVSAHVCVWSGDKYARQKLKKAA